MKNEGLNVSILDFGAIGDERGMITVCEGEQDIPFIPKRVFIFTNPLMMWLGENMLIEYLILSLLMWQVLQRSRLWMEGEMRWSTH